MTIKVLLVDDEPLAREGIRLRLEQEADIKIISESGGGSEAIRSILSDKPDVVFLDINMPKVNGFDVIRAVGVENMPLVVFLTAYDQYAIEAFEVNAVDYILKPLSRERLEQSLARIREQLNSNNIGKHVAQLQSLLGGMSDTERTSSPGKPSERIQIRSHGRVVFVTPDDIRWIEADGDYINIHTTTASHLMRESLRNMEQRLQDSGFQRIHRSTLIRLSLVRELLTNDAGDYTAVLDDNTQLKVSRSYREQLISSLTEQN
ncbi:LytTR family DNA-binding domain-containing protein [Aliikangiella sp. G2MR2-5]|uniref:LytR/AlgR family response regulator transcription factor n=1 Tax=Aliikangiella sp. G2MR2-5 TaxID=2788943 RepID=UPI0018AAD192|nr:LytTR family DNA-binding domain-containing protein [Aliikangiella sp. G2MR2-5]